MKKALIFIVCILVGTISLLTIYKDVSFKKVGIPLYGSIMVPKDWYATDSNSGLILSNKSIGSSDSIIYMFQFEYENKQNDWFVKNDQVGTFLVLGIDKVGKGGVYSNNTEITPLKIMIDKKTYNYYELTLWTIKETKVMFLINSEYVQWTVIEKIAQSFAENN